MSIFSPIDREEALSGSRESRFRIPLPDWLRRKDGAMTQQLLLHHGEHGLGMTHPTLAADTTTTAVCGYCSTGCGLRLHLREGSAVGLTPETEYPVNLGMACPKGWEALQVLDAADRGTRPLLRNSQGVLQPVSWDAALTTFVSRFQAIQQQHGPESIAFLGTGQITCEELAFLGALCKFGMGMVHGDGNTRQCMATAVTAYKESFGFDAPPYSYDDFEQSDCLVFVGANPCVGHPIMWERVLRNRNAPQILVVDPRRTETAMAASQHLQLRPKTDLIFLYGLTRELIHSSRIDRDFIDQHTHGFEELTRHVERYTLEYVTERTGLSSAAILRAAEAIGTGTAVSFWWTMGVNQSYEGTRTAQALINLALITGNIGRPGTGANSITGQCNAMGSRLWSNTTNLIGHHRFESAADRGKVARILQIPVERIPTRTGWSYEEILAGVRRGEIRGLWVIGTNPAHSWIHQQEAREIFEQLDFLVVQDMYHTSETARQADLFLPAAGWGEKEGTLINSERRYGLVKQVRRPPGEALADFQIFRAISHYWGLDDLFGDWNRPEALFQKLQQLSECQTCDITGIESYAQIDRCGGIQWPWTAADALTGDPSSGRRLFSDGQFPHADGKARLIVAEPGQMPEVPDHEYPFLLLTGRGTVSQWHTQTRTSKSAVLRSLYPNQPYLELHPADAALLCIEPGEECLIRSRRGEMRARAWVVATVRPGQVFVPMHYPQTNQLTLAHFDPHSRQPSYKDCAVAIQRAPQQGLLEREPTESMLSAEIPGRFRSTNT